MTKYNPENERTKHEYYHFLKEADQKADSTIRSIRNSIIRFEKFTNFEDFRSFNKQQAVSFKQHLKETPSQRTNQPLGASTILTTINAIKKFLNWLSYQPGYKSYIHYSDIQYLNLSEKEVRSAKSTQPKQGPKLEDVKSVLHSMPTNTPIEKRNRALIAFTILTGIRDGALISLKLKHIDLENELVKQDPSEVHTKFSKRIDTFFFPVGDDVKTIVINWVHYLKEEEKFKNTAPLFPQSSVTLNKKLSYISDGLVDEHWKNATPVRTIFKSAFKSQGLPYFNPHSFRNTLVALGEQFCTTPEEFKAWSQNLGHEEVLTTFTSYGNLTTSKQGDTIKNISLDPDRKSLQHISKEELIQMMAEAFIERKS